MLLESILEDIRVYLLATNKPTLIRVVYFFFRSIQCRVIIRLRLSQFLLHQGMLGRFVAWHLYNANFRVGVDIHPAASIGKGLRLAHPLGIVIGEHVKIGNYVRIQHLVTLGGSSGRVRLLGEKKLLMPVIEDYCFVGPGACVLGPVVLGKGSVVGANSVVASDVESWSVVVGAPAKAIKKISAENMLEFHYEKMLPQSMLINE